MMQQSPSGNATPSVRAEYHTLARSYERRWGRYLAVSTARSLALLEPRTGECILDAGCGTGMLLREVVARAPGAQLVGLDLTLAMLCQADPTMFDRVLGDVSRLPFVDASLDAVAVISVLQYLPDLDATLAGIARVLRPHGRVVITWWDSESWRTRMLSRWLRWRHRAHVYLHARADIITSCRDHGLTIDQEQHYSAGYAWGLATLLAVKRATHDSIPTVPLAPSGTTRMP